MLTVTVTVIVTEHMMLYYNPPEYQKNRCQRLNLLSALVDLKCWRKLVSVVRCSAAQGVCHTLDARIELKFQIATLKEIHALLG